MKQIPLTKNKFAIVDDKDFERLNRFKWSASSRSYGGFAASRECNCPLVKDSYAFIYMHRQITSCPKGLEVDHISHNTLDNRRINLRIVTKGQNQMNSKPKTGSVSKYKGVFRLKNSKKWMAQIRFNGKATYLGLFKDEVEAAKKYNTKAKELFGEFAFLNVVNKIAI